MNRLPALLLAAGTALAVPAFAQTVDYRPVERTTTYVWDPVTGSYVARTTTYYDDVTAPATVIYEPAPTVVYSDPVVVTAPALTTDEAITADVVDRIASDPRISGRVGVETYRNNVTLTGRVTSPVQVDRAERDARSVDGVREVTNLIRPRVGGF